MSIVTQLTVLYFQGYLLTAVQNGVKEHYKWQDCRFYSCNGPKPVFSFYGLW